MAVQSLVFHIASDGVLVAPPEFNLLAVPDFLANVQTCCAGPGTADLVVDLSHVEVLEPAAFRALVWARRYCTSRRRTLAVMPPGCGVLRPQEQAVLLDLFPAR